ncbi:hypothetical protein [Granulicella mallensis]|uniref:Formylmethanofuran dehydrogenase subunit A n=1 Tax=Granulicella mallensis TaxID=940614 RepID=A0A7W8E976_9BACT|nr:hypothetical protein [Granulicella mallensis]MBB5064188.1 formylmethanofuran dehydrogenase subunit A [Granulicella mallensis]
MDKKSGGSRVAKALLRSLDIHLHCNHLGGPPRQTLTPESTPDSSGISTFAGTGTSISQVTIGGRTMQLNARLAF